MANISIFDLQFNDSESPLVFLETEKSALIKAAVERSIDARKIGGGRRKHCGLSHPNDKPRKNYDEYFV